MAGRFFILQQVEDFAPGYFENTVLEDGAVQLARQDNGYFESGCYTSTPFQSEAFFSLIPSWNAATPKDTWVEMQARIACDGQWSRWFSFGAWSPYIKRASMPPEADEVAGCNAEVLQVAEGNPGAEAVQLRVWLHARGGQASPRVRLLAASTNAAQQVHRDEPVYDRELELPAYACLNRDPMLAGHMASATSLTMLMNRWGRDLLPEEVARCGYDWESGRYGSLSFLCAVGAVYGFRCHVAYAGILALRQEVWQGHAVAARVQYRMPPLDGEQRADEERPLAPVLEGAFADSTDGHLVVVRGFVQRDDAEYVLLNDPLAPGDDKVVREMLIQQFSRIYTGLALFVHRGDKTSGTARPTRKVARLELEGGYIRLLDGTEELLPARLADGTLGQATVCCTVADGVAYANAAQQRFYYPVPDEEGRLPFEGGVPLGRKFTLYLIGPMGNSWVAEKIPTEDEGTVAGS